MNLKRIDRFFDIMDEKNMGLKFYPGDGSILSRTFIRVCYFLSKPWRYGRKHRDNPSRGTSSYYEGVI